MLGQQKKHAVPGWSMILVAGLLLLVAVSLILNTTGIGLNVSLLDSRPSSQESTQLPAQPSVDILRAAKPDFTVGFVPETTMANRAVSVEVLRAAKPNFTGGFVPETTMDDRAVSVEVLRAAKPDFVGGFVPEATIGGQQFATDVEFSFYDQEPNHYSP